MRPRLAGLPRCLTGSPARRNCHHRVEHGIWLTPGDAARGTVTSSA